MTGSGRVGVIIPYYRTEPGQLRRALASALAQEAAPPLTIIVTDDASPMPVGPEIEGLDFAEPNRLILLHQQNAGPGPARNAALDALAADAEWIAFLDSDDTWEKQHLTRAVKALAQGYDFFFADLLRETDADTHFGLNPFVVTRHQPLDVAPDIYAFKGDFFTQTLTLSPVGTSTVVMRAVVLGDLRFPDSRDLWEDLVFWLQAAQRTTRIAFDATVQARYGSGGLTVAADWKSNHELRNVLAYQSFYLGLSRRFPLTGEQLNIVRSLIRHSDEAFCRIVVGMLRAGRKPDPRVLRTYIARNPTILARFLRVLGGEGIRRLLG